MSDATLRLEQRSYGDPAAADLIGALQDEYRVIYGGPDDTPVDVAEFDPPDGLFLLAFDADGHAVGSGGWRRHTSPGGPSGDVVEIKRMYVSPAARGSGVGRALVAELERTAAQAGARRVVLMTGGPQVAALALYAACGYVAAPAYGYYADPTEYPDALFFGKDLP